MLQRQSARRIGGKLALFALLLQLVLSFGHLHPEDIYGPLGHPIVQGHGVTEVAPLPHDVPFRPIVPANANAVEDGCAICASMALLASSVLPERLRLPVPRGQFASLSADEQPLLLRATPFLLFHTRAPPAV